MYLVRKEHCQHFIGPSQTNLRLDIFVFMVHSALVKHSDSLQVVRLKTEILQNHTYCLDTEFNYVRLG